MTYNIPLTAISDALDLLPAVMTSDDAIVMLIAIGLQESRFKHRVQIGGPAHGFWQFESGGGVKGVMQHPASKKHARTLCTERGIEFSRASIYDAIIDDDVLAAGMARLLLWTDAKPLPSRDQSWDYYYRNWRPGKPHPETWLEFYDHAVEMI